MSLLLLFKPQTATTSGWVLQNLALSSWSIYGYDYKHLWSDWGSYTWGVLGVLVPVLDTSGNPVYDSLGNPVMAASTEGTWGFLRGDTFTMMSTTPTTWIIQGTAT